MNKKSADKLIGGNRHHLMFTVILVVPPFEGNYILFNANDTFIRYSHPVGISTQIFNNTSSIFKRWFTVNNPLFAIDRGEQLYKFLIVRKISLTTVEFKLILAVELF